MPPVYVLTGHLILQQKGYIVENGAGYDKRILDEVQKFLNEAGIPGLACEEIDIRSGTFSRNIRHFLRVTQDSLREYRMFFEARGVGTYLEASWFLTVIPGTLRRALSKRMYGSPEALSSQLPLFDQQDLQVWVKVGESVLEKVVKTLYEELKLDPTGLNTQSRGYLNIW
jgi:hypothetical protein